MFYFFLVLKGPSTFLKRTQVCEIKRPPELRLNKCFDNHFLVKIIYFGTWPENVKVCEDNLAFTLLKMLKVKH